MNTHEKLKRICDEIGYLVDAHYDNENGFHWSYSCDYCNDNCTVETLDEREIIFTQEFMDKFVEYTNNKDEFGEGFRYFILKNLSNPTDYLYNLLFNK